MGCKTVKSRVLPVDFGNDPFSRRLELEYGASRRRIRGSTGKTRDVAIFEVLVDW